MRSNDTDRFSYDPEQLSRFLCRPIVFQRPDRVVHPPSWAEHIPFAFWIVDVLRPTVFVELGTQSGNSYAAFAQAIQLLELPAAAYCVDTWRGDPQAGFYDEGVFTEWARYHDEHFSAFSRLVRSTFEEAVVHFSDGSIDLLHIDGWHTYDAVAQDFRTWRPKLSRRGVVLLHDINVRERDFGAWRLWEELRVTFPSFEFLHGHGLGVVALGPDLPEPLRWLLSRVTAGDREVAAVRQFFTQAGSVVSARLEASERERELATRTAQHAQAARTVQEQAAALGRQVEELIRLRGQVSVTAQALEAGAIEARRIDAQIADLRNRLTSEEAQHQESRRKAGSVASELHARLRHVEAERDLALNMTEPGTGRQQVGAIQAAASPLRQGRLRRLARTAVAIGLVPTRGWAPRCGARILSDSAALREARAVESSGLFDADYYRGRYPDVASGRLTPLGHFVLKGAREGRSPHALFDAAYYLRRNLDVVASGVNPLLHYLARGAFEGRNPHPLFDVTFYLNENPDVKSAGSEPLRHFINLGAAEGRRPNPFFDVSYYLNAYPDVAARRINPLVHFVNDGWREGRRPAAAFDPAHYLARYDDVRPLEVNPLAHYLEYGRFEGRTTVDDRDGARAVQAPDITASLVRLEARSLVPARAEQPTVLCLTHVMPWPPRAGNEYRIYRMLCWLRDQGYRVVPLVAPLPGARVDREALHGLADAFSNAVVCERTGRLEYILRDVPDVLASLEGEFTRPVSTLLGEDIAGRGGEPQLLHMDRTFCHDALITTALRLHQVLGSYVLLTEYIWMSRILPLISSNVVKVIDTIDVFSTKRDKVIQFGIDDVHVEPEEEAARLRRADLILAIQDEERQALQRLMPGKRVVTAGVDVDVVEDGGTPSGRKVLYVASDNPMNRKGLLDFLRFAWPQIRRDVPDAELLVAGRVSGTLEADVPGVIRLGLVDDLKPLYRQSRVVINPAVAGTGLKIKTLEALGHLRPLVTWPSGSEGLATELADLCVPVQDWFEFARHVTAFLATDTPRLFSDAQRDTIVRLTSPAASYQAMTEAIADLRRLACRA